MAACQQLGFACHHMIDCLISGAEMGTPIQENLYGSNKLFVCSLLPLGCSPSSNINLSVGIVSSYIFCLMAYCYCAKVLKTHTADTECEWRRRQAAVPDAVESSGS